MSVERRLYLLAVYFATFYGIQAIQPSGYLGCFLDENGESLINSTPMYSDRDKNNGDYCKNTCKSNLKRYAGTKGWKCFGGDDYNKSRNSKECSNKCPGNNDEICGDKKNIIIYDTWMCITRPCQNGATCNDINADKFTCHCTEGWTGHFCDAQTSKSLLAIYISALLGVIIPAIGVTTFLIIRKRRTRKKDHTCAIDNKSQKANHTFSNTAYKHQDIQPDIPVYTSATAGHKANQNIDGIGEESDYQYETHNTDINNEIPVDEYGYGHLKSKTTVAFFDPTYSHTTNLQKNNKSDNTYSHVDRATEKLKSDVMLKDADADGTYSHVSKPAGKLKPGLNMNVTDETYSKLNNTGTTMNQRDRIGKHTEMGQNEPEYDHT